MQLQDDVGREGNVTGARVDRVQHRAVACDLGLRPIPWLGRVRDDLLDTPAGRSDVLDRVRGPHALDQRGMPECLELRRVLARERLLASSRDVDLAQLACDRGRHEAEALLEVTEAAHARKLQAPRSELWVLCRTTHSSRAGATGTPASQLS